MRALWDCWKTPRQPLSAQKRLPTHAGVEQREQQPRADVHRVSIQSDYQLKQPLLCSACERRFSVNGESYVVPLLKKGNRFPLLDKLKLAVPLYCTQTNTAFVCQSVGLVGEKIGYFGLSILWRAAARTWQMFDRATTSVVLGSNHLESLRKYLAGEAAFPGRQYRCYREPLRQTSCPRILASFRVG